MYDLHQRLWIALSLSTIAFAPLWPALANPRPLESVVTSQPTNKAPKNNSVSTTPLDAVLASVRAKTVPQIKAKGGRDRQMLSRPPHAQNSAHQATKAKDRSLQGISHLTDTNRNSPKMNVSAVDRLIK
ncbi:hypothetical protein [Chamaesiphon sp. VAR_69_metabat_338]|uniref:hypothetical protein n=1 Tax=Chamaesiphon sp. VAR_69_metabat_338 TaxID=2964704 RepID=UPI00286DE5ED|nr:hypothetical protein [Chamaesiphon sp. VAR_69_metabat_338]